MVKIILHGCAGRMGGEVARLALKDEETRIAAGVDKKQGGKFPYPVYKSMAKCQEEADAVIDFSNAEALDGLLSCCRKRRLPLVLCTTGLGESQIKKAREAAADTAVLMSGNMSLGMNLLLRLVKETAKILAAYDFDMEIIEKHHNQKEDAPSGTALALAEAAREALGGEYRFVFDRSAGRGKRGRREIGVSSVRGGGIIGEHEALFAGEEEAVELKHSVFSRAVFARGALRAAKFLAGKPPGLYRMTDVIRL